jgi:hypothetical protein
MIEGDAAFMGLFGATSWGVDFLVCFFSPEDGRSGFTSFDTLTFGGILMDMTLDV